MSKILQNLKVGLDQSLEEQLAWMMPEHGPFRILRQSVDARARHAPHFVYSVEVAESGESLQTPDYPVERLKPSAGNSWGPKPLIIGSGPAGLFAALRLVERGIPCILFERGSAAEKRIVGINKFWRYGELDPRNNVCFGEGGAGLYSDGKLITRVKSPYIPYVLHRLVKFGAPEEIQFLSNPHVGSDKIRRVIPKMRKFLLENGCEIHFDTKVTEFLTTPDKVAGRPHKITGVRTEKGQTFSSDHIILATGHSAEDTLNQILLQGIFTEEKDFAMGLRVEHPQALINKIQYKHHANHPKLKSSNYRLTHHDHKTQIGVYSFCMCPGGYVLSSGTEPDGLVCNGMSNFNRNSAYANAAIVVTTPGRGGLQLRRTLEQKAFAAVQIAGGTKQLPAQKLLDFLNHKKSSDLKGSSPSGMVSVRLDELLPENIVKSLREGFESFQKSMPGFVSENATLYGVESRTSCPIRVTRHEEDLQSLSHAGLYPCGEGAGYAGGITSAACDGIRVAEQIAQSLSPSLAAELRA
jgi:uncharacterized FAD-dependent dehydrogenase